MLRLYLVRHCETHCNVAGFYCGRCNVALTEHGQLMAQDLAQQLAKLPFSAIYASPLPRAQQTAAPLMQKTGLVLQTCHGMQEVNYGVWDGLTQEQIQQQYAPQFHAWLDDPVHVSPPGGETVAAVAARATDAMAELQKAHQDGLVCLVAHKSIIRILLCALTKQDLHLYRESFPQPSGAINIIDFTGGHPVIQEVGKKNDHVCKLCA